MTTVTSAGDFLNGETLRMLQDKAATVENLRRQFQLNWFDSAEDREGFFDTVPPLLQEIEECGMGHILTILRHCLFEHEYAHEIGNAASRLFASARLLRIRITMQSNKLRGDAA